MEAKQERERWRTERGGLAGRGQARRAGTGRARKGLRMPFGSSGRVRALPWPAPSSSSAHETQPDFSKLVGEESQKSYCISEVSRPLLHLPRRRHPEFKFILVALLISAEMKKKNGTRVTVHLNGSAAH